MAVSVKINMVVYLFVKFWLLWKYIKKGISGDRTQHGK
jgi:hypothetical protein